MTKADLNKTVLFRGMSAAEIDAALSSLNTEEKTCAKGETLLFAGETVKKMGLVLSGGVIIENIDVWGSRTILNHIGEGRLFAEIYALLPEEPLLVNVTASEESRVLFLDGGLGREDEGESWRRKFNANLMTVIAKKGLTLSGRIFHTAPKSVRGRVTAYLNSVSLRKKSREFDIPFDRQQLADYLNVDRSALSKELGAMKREGLIETKKNHFKLIDPS